jgi:hypothetical protein
VRIALSAWHSIVDHDDLALLHGLGYEVVNLGAYLDPRHPADPKRPPLDIDPPPQEVVDACRDTHAAKMAYPPELFEWLGSDGVLIVHHFIPEGIFAQWPRLRAWGGRVIWRSCGQTGISLEQSAAFYRRQGLERVGYSPKEANLPFHSGMDAVIRFAMDPDDYQGWTGQYERVINITQNLAQRGEAVNYPFWQQATEGLPAVPLGPGSDAIGGPGELGWDDMREALRVARAYLYTGTRFAPYTLGLLEAGMTGIPIVSIGPKAWGAPDLFEGHELAPLGGFDDPAQANRALRMLLNDHALAQHVSAEQRAFFVENFGKDTIAAQWRNYLEGQIA